MYACLVIPIFAIYLTRSITSNQSNRLTFAWYELSLKSLFIIFDIYFVCRFIHLVKFFI